MNRLILIGNGFDLAHGFKTSYKDFICDYLIDFFEKVRTSHIGNSDEFLDAGLHYPQYLDGPNAVKEFIEKCYNDEFKSFYHGGGWNLENVRMPFKIIIKSRLFEELLFKCATKNWAGVESTFYNLLITIKTDKGRSELEKLNRDFRILITLLEEYLTRKGPNKEFKSNRYLADLMTSEITPKNYYLTEYQRSNIDASSPHPKELMLLNFNYTTTVNHYARACASNGKIDISCNYVHGELHSDDNPIIFGYGDEIGKEFNEILLHNDNAYLEHIKSYGYHMTENYHELITFLENQIFEVYIMGHSCGLSDRTLLNLIMEHKNCASIKIFYHETTTGNNYRNTVMDISRHFSDKNLQRSRIVSYEKCKRLPQPGFE